jgi:hypothetical protein
MENCGASPLFIIHCSLFTIKRESRRPHEVGSTTKIILIMKKNYMKIAVMACAACMVMAGCGKDDDPKSAACEISSFTVEDEKWNISGTDITYTYPTETQERQMTPTITVSGGATVSPASGAAQNFFTPQGVTYTVMAEDGATTKTYTAKASIKAVKSGDTGECTWALTGAAGNYTLTVSGNGPMGEHPFSDTHIPGIKTLIIQDGVTTIGKKAFSSCRDLTSLTIGNSVRTIGEEAFFQCESVTDTLIIPNSVISIGKNAFDDCNSLTSVSIGSSLSTIGMDSTSLGFGGCRGLIAISVDAANPYFSSVDGVLFNKDKTTLITYPRSKAGNYTIPNSVTTIGIHAFNQCTKLTGTPTIPNKVTTIGDYAFHKCGELSGSLTIPNSVTSIGKKAFYNCTRFTDVTIGVAVETIGNEAFAVVAWISVTSLNVTPPSLGEAVFNSVQNTCKLKVPTGKVPAYKAARGWGVFTVVEEIKP